MRSSSSSLFLKIHLKNLINLYMAFWSIRSFFFFSIKSIIWYTYVKFIFHGFNNPETLIPLHPHGNPNSSLLNEVKVDSWAVNSNHISTSLRKSIKECASIKLNSRSKVSIQKKLVADELQILIKAEAV